MHRVVRVDCPITSPPPGRHWRPPRNRPRPRVFWPVSLSEPLLPARFEDVYERYAPDVFRFALYLSGSRSDAEDITAETFVRAFVARQRIDAATLKGYLFTIARHLFLKSLRHRGRQAPLPDDLRHPGVSASHRAEARSELEAVLARLQVLPPLDRAALLMRAFQDSPYDEIARWLGISAASARVKVHRARAKLMAADPITPPLKEPS
jgi:RNA polymerase sigma-70 factor (ECF subfamily)